MAATDDLIQQLDTDIQVLSQLQSLLEEERTALETNAVESIQDIHPRKAYCLDQLRESARRKVHFLVQLGFRPDTGEALQFVRSLGEPRLTERWVQAQDALRHCQFVNEVNGRVIAHLQRRVDRLTEILRGQATQPKLYGKAGKETGLGGSMILASA